MLVEPGEWVLLLPAQTRYEQKGGGTLTSTERRIRYSPEIPGPRIGEAMAEWEIFMRIGKAALGPEKSHLIHFDDSDAIRAEMECAMPLYRGIASLHQEGEAVQYGGSLLCANGVCANLPDGRARFSVIAPPRLEPPPGAAVGRNHFYLATRRGKQFNSMVFGASDPLTGSKRRDEILICAEDATRFRLAEGDALRLHSSAGEMLGVCHIAPVVSGTLQTFWPEANVLIGSQLDPSSKEPDYNAWVNLEKDGEQV